MSKSTPLYAVLGHPIAHSLSPEIHHAFAAQVGIDLHYTRFDVAPDDFGTFWHGGDGTELVGANITSPLKGLAFELVDEAGQHAQEAGAVNTIVRRGDKLLGYNTDGCGLLTDLKQNLSLPINGQRLLLLGAGGASRGIVGPLLRDIPAELVIANRTLGKAEDLMAQFRGKVPICVSALEDLHQAGSFDGIINATSLGHNANNKPDDIGLPSSLLKPFSWCYDLSYGAAAEPFSSWVKDAGNIATHDGLGMLVEQAAESFRYWHGLSPRTNSVIQSLRGTSKRTENIR